MHLNFKYYKTDVPGHEGDCVRVDANGRIVNNNSKLCRKVIRPDHESIKESGYDVWQFSNFKVNLTIFNATPKVTGNPFWGWIDEDDVVHSIESFDHSDKPTFYGEFVRLQQRVQKLEEGC